MNTIQVFKIAQLCVCGIIQDGTGVQLRSVTLQKFVSADNGGGAGVTVNRDAASSWETFRVRGSIRLFFLLSYINMNLILVFGNHVSF